MGAFLGGSFLDGNCPVGIIRVAVLRVGVFPIQPGVMRGVIRPGGRVNLLPLYFLKTKNDINMKPCIVVLFYINFKKIIFIVSCRWLF